MAVSLEQMFRQTKFRLSGIAVLLVFEVTAEQVALVPVQQLDESCGRKQV